MTTLNTAGIDTLLERLRSLMEGDARRDALLYIGRRVGVAAEGYGRAYPERVEGVPLPKIYKTAKGVPTAFKSLKQQRKVFSLIAAGKVPRTRTGHLGNSITSDVATDGDGVLISVGSKLDYAKYVIGGADQNKYLASLGWQSLPAAIDDNLPELRQVVIDSLSNYLEGYVNG